MNDSTRWLHFTGANVTMLINYIASLPSICIFDPIIANDPIESEAMS